MLYYIIAYFPLFASPFLLLLRLFSPLWQISYCKFCGAGTCSLKLGKLPYAVKAITIILSNNNNFEHLYLR